MSSPSSRDVRMKGFSKRTPVADVVDWIVANARPQATEAVALESASGRVLAQEIVSEVNVPAFVRSMMDGYAVYAEDTQGATDYNALKLEVVGQALPAQPFEGTVNRGQAVRIMTGAPMPDGANAVLPVEHTNAGDGSVEIHSEVTPAKNVGSIGEDVASGTAVLPQGRRLRPQDLGVLSSLGHKEITVYRKPVVRIVVTGNELLAPGSKPEPNKIIDANSPMLQALVARDGGTVIHPGILPDTPEIIEAAITSPADVILVSGGSSVGQEDYAPQVVAEKGELPIHGISMRPSSPAGMGRVGETLVFLLPGNPVSCLCAYDFFAGYAIRLMGGAKERWAYSSEQLPLARKLVSVVGRVDYARVRIVDGKVDPIAISGASVLSSTTRADGFVIIDEDSEGMPEGEIVRVYRYSQL